MSGTEIQLQTSNGVAVTTTVDVKQVLAQVQAIQKIMASVMKEGTHYGKIPGCDQPSLYKPGSESLLSAFKISVEPEVREIRDGNHITYQVRCIGRHMATGIVVGVGVGEASTAEDKYAWRAAVCDEEFDATPEDRRRVKWGKSARWAVEKGEPPYYSVKQVRTNPADIANTVLKMAKKRAQIDLCLTSLAASDIFTQDLEDIPEEMRDDGAPPRPRNRYQERPKSGETRAAPTGEVTEGQVRLIKARLSSKSKSEADLLAHFKVESVEAIQKAQVNDVLAWIEAEQ